MKKFLLFIVLILILPINSYAKQGCCSWHGGVSHCGDNGRYVCNDGTYSPSCTCTPTVTYKYGCTNRDALNYNSSANRDDGSCIYKVYGCMNSEAMNYNSFANVDDGSCVYRVYGCMNSGAINYNASANTVDGSCLFEEEIVEEIEIPYEIISEIGQKNMIRQKGSNGKKSVVTKNIKDELGNVVSYEIVENIIVEPINEIRVKKVETVFEEKSDEDNDINYQQEDNDDTGGVSGFSYILVIILTIFGVYKLKK